VTGQELCGDAAKADHDRQLLGAARKAQRADAEVEAARVVAYRPAALEQDRTDPMCRALWNPEHPRDLREAYRSACGKQVEHAQGRLDPGRAQTLNAGGIRVFGAAALFATRHCTE